MLEFMATCYIMYVHLKDGGKYPRVMKCGVGVDEDLDDREIADTLESIIDDLLGLYPELTGKISKVEIVKQSLRVEVKEKGEEEVGVDVSRGGDGEG